MHKQTPHARTRARTHTHERTHARTHARTHTHNPTYGEVSGLGVKSLDEHVREHPQARHGHQLGAAEPARARLGMEVNQHAPAPANQCTNQPTEDQPTDSPTNQPTKRLTDQPSLSLSLSLSPTHTHTRTHAPRQGCVCRTGRICRAPRRVAGQSADPNRSSQGQCTPRGWPDVPRG